MSYIEFEKILNEQKVEHYLTFAIPNIPEINKGEDLGRIIFEKSQKIGGFKNKDIIIVASKIVSKSEGRIIDTSLLELSPEAIKLSEAIGKQPQVCQAILNESAEYNVRKSGVVIARHKLGYVLTSAGVDRIDDLIVSLIPENPDLSARRIRESIEKISGKEIAVVISDSEGREDRGGAGSICLGISGMNPLRITETRNLSGKVKKSEETISDFLSSAGAIIIGQRGKQTPVACIRGVNYSRDLEASILGIIHS